MIWCFRINHHLEAFHGTVEIKRIQRAAHETDFVGDDGAVVFPVFGDHVGDVELFPMFDDTLVNPAGLSIKHRPGKAGLFIPG